MKKKQINILMSFPKGLAPSLERQDRIKSVDKRIQLHDISEAVMADLANNSGARDNLDGIPSHAEIFFGARPLDDLIQKAPNLRWIHSPLAGIEPFLRDDIISSNVILTRASIHSEQISEAVFNMILMLARHSYDYFKQQQQSRWIRLSPTILHSKTLGIIGLGNIGKAVARLAKAFGMKVIATKAHPDGHYTNVDLVLGADKLGQLLGESDFVVVLVPITERSRNLIGEPEIQMMKKGTFIINVSRGGVVDEEALVKALNTGWIAGAAIDVFACEPSPLPPDSILWSIPNLIITPHIAGLRPDYDDLLIEQFIKNLKRYISGRPLENQVNKQLGY
jgi:D-2-hydroxyacid dehydrogenase (NADP+)